METDRLHEVSHLGNDSSVGNHLWRRPGAFRPVRQTAASYSSTGKAARPLRFPSCQGNLKYAPLIIVLIWVLAAFGEELVYRAYLMNRVADLGRGTRTAWIVSLLLISALFGFSHYNQGLTGIVEEGSDGLILGLMYLAYRRNLAIPIVTHGVCDTIDIALLFLGKYPGL